MKPIYSIRDSLGREVSWTTGRKAAIQLADDLNAIGVGAAVRSHGGRTHAYQSRGANGLSAHALPVAVYRSVVAKYTISLKKVTP